MLDNETASLTMVPKPKPRTIKAPAPVPTPRRVFTEPILRQNNVDKIDEKPVDTEPMDDSVNEDKIAIASTPARNESKFDTMSRSRGFQIGQSMLSIDSSENMRRNISSSTLNSSSSSHEHEIVGAEVDHFENIQIKNIDIFDNTKRVRKKKHSHKTENLVEINDLRHNKTYEEFLSNSPSNTSLELPVNDSLLSLRSVTSLPGFLDNETKIRKWENLQSLDVSIADDRNSSHHWVLGDPSDADSTAPATPNDTNSLPRTSTVSLASTNFTPETTSLQSMPATISSDSKKPSVSTSLSEEETKSFSKAPSLNVESNERKTPEKLEPPVQFSKEIKEEKMSPNESSATKKIPENVPVEPSQDDLDTEWQYTLPSPPTAFRDSSPTNFTDVTNYDTVTFNGLTNDSIVTSPALFEKLESISNTRSEVEEDTISNASSINNKKQVVESVESASNVKEPEAETVEEIKEEKVLTSKYLSLETLEKRKSLVLERELASLKITQNESVATAEQTVKSQRDSLRNEIEEVIQNRSRSATLSRTNSQSREKLLASAADSTLPNFKITTYDQPKSKINIFEDDSIRSSNIEFIPSKVNNPSAQVDDADILRKRNNSTENIYFAKRNSMDDFIFKKPDLPTKFTKKQGVDSSQENRNADMVSRSESFSTQKHIWNRASPVKRSKSHISLDKYNKEDSSTEESLHKSNSLYNVSGLQSLEVMRMILPKLGNTPPSSPSEEKKVNPLEQKPQAPPKPEIRKEAPATTKKYQYSGPPAINFASWSERPKTQVSIKEDTDYKFNNIKAKFNGSKPQENGSANSQSYPPVNIRVNSSNSKDQVDSGKINIKINGEEPNKPTSPTSGNVVIKIGSSNTMSKSVDEEKTQKNILYTRFLNQTTAVGYRKPLGNINGVDKPRPHSIAFDASCPDLSRVPIVRAVELKKPFKEPPGNNKSITQILHDTTYEVPRQNGTDEHNQQDKSKSLGNQYRHSSVYLSNENINKLDQNGSNKVLSVFSSKPISRGNSFATPRNNSNGNINTNVNVNPVVKGFRDSDQKKVFPFNNTKSSDSFVPFSQHTLRRTENSTLQKPVSQTERPSIFETVTLRKTANRHSLPVTVETKSPQAPVPPPPAPAPAPPPPKPNIFGTNSRKTIQRQLPVEDPRDQLLESIRNFGGKAGLKAVKL